MTDEEKRQRADLTVALMEVFNASYILGSRASLHGLMDFISRAVDYIDETTNEQKGTFAHAVITEMTLKLIKHSGMPDCDGSCADCKKNGPSGNDMIARDIFGKDGEPNLNKED